LYDTTAPPLYAVEAFHTAAVQLPLDVCDVDGDVDGEVDGDVLGELVVVLDDGGGGGTATPANFAVNLVKSQSFCGTEEQLPDSWPLLSGGLHCRSRFTDQYV
jgi:hypothetical protein